MSAFYPYVCPPLSIKKSYFRENHECKHSHEQLYTCI